MTIRDLVNVINTVYVKENEDAPRVHPSLQVVSDHLHSQGIGHNLHPTASGGHIEVDHASNGFKREADAPMASATSDKVAQHVHTAISNHDGPAEKETEDHLTHSMSGKGSQGRGRNRAVMSANHHVTVEDHGQKSVIRSAE